MKRDYQQLTAEERLKLAEANFKELDLNESLDAFLKTDKIKSIIDSGYKKYEKAFFEQTQDFSEKSQAIPNCKITMVHITKDAFIDCIKMVFKIKLTSIIEEQKAASKSNLIISSGLKCLLSTHMPSFMIEIAQTFIDEAVESQLYANRALAVFDLVVAQIKSQK